MSVTYKLILEPASIFYGAIWIYTFSNTMALIILIFTNIYAPAWEEQTSVTVELSISHLAFVDSIVIVDLSYYSVRQPCLKLAYGFDSIGEYFLFKFIFWIINIEWVSLFYVI